MKTSRRFFEIREKDEFKHEQRKYPEHHNESWYFNFIDFHANTYMVTRVGYRIGAKEVEIMLLLIVDGDTKEYFNRVKIEGFPKEDIYGDNKVKYECLELMKKWRITYNDEEFEVDVVFEERFKPYLYGSQEDPMETLKKYGMEILKVAATKHYEQGMNATGVVKLKEKGQVKDVRQINCYGHRDHSWGIRNWILIDKWNWMACQFDDCTINSARVEVFGKIITRGFISTDEKQEPVTNVEVETEYGHEGNQSIPKSSSFKITTPTRQFIIKSNTCKSLYIQRPNERGLTEVYEQIVDFEMEGKKGYGISEYMISTPNKK